jgi:hypothetical protein
MGESSLVNPCAYPSFHACGYTYIRGDKVVTCFITYCRVSTDRQGASSLGMEAQRTDVPADIGIGKLLTEYTQPHAAGSPEHMLPAFAHPLPTRIRTDGAAA